MQFIIYKFNFLKILLNNYFSKLYYFDRFKESKRKLLFQRERNEHLHVNVVKVNLSRFLFNL